MNGGGGSAPPHSQADNLRLPLRLAFRELRAQRARLAFYAASLAVGVAAFVAMSGFSRMVVSGASSQTRNLLGADVVASLSREFPESAIVGARALAGVRELTLVESTLAMARGAGERNAVPRLVEIRTTSGKHPLFGDMRTLPGITPAELGPDEALVDRSLVDAWALVPGQDRILVGSRSFLIRAILEEESDRGFWNMGPRVYISPQSAREAGIIGSTSRYSQSLRLALAPGGPGTRDVSRELSRVLSAAKVSGTRIQTHEEAPGTQPVRQLNMFLSQLALTAFLLALVGTVSSLSAYLHERSASLAILRFLGLTPRQVGLMFSYVCGILVLTGTLFGIILGELLAWGVLPLLLAQAVPGPFLTALQQAGSSALFQALLRPAHLELVGLSLAVVSCFLGPRLWSLRAIPPISLLRESGEAGAPLPIRIVWTFRLATLACAALLFFRYAPNPRVAAALASALFALFAAFWGANIALLKLARLVAARAPFAVRLGLRELAARPQVTRLTMTSLGLAMFLAFTIHFTRSDLLAPLALGQAGGKPNLFFVDVQKAQADGVASLVQEETGQAFVSAPVVRARITELDGVPVRSAVLEEAPDSAWSGNGNSWSGAETGSDADQRARFLRREQNLTYRDALSAGEEVLEGRFWTSADARSEQLSLESDFARRIGAKLGSRIRFDVQGIPLAATVTSLRRVNWQNWRPNFFIVVHPDLISDAPQTIMGAATAPSPEARERLVQRAAARFTNVSVIDVTETVKRLSGIVEVVAGVVQLLSLGLFASALSVLFGTVLATRYERLRASAILRVLGGKTSVLLAAHVVEFGALAALSSGLSLIFAKLASAASAQSLLGLPAAWGFAGTGALWAGAVATCVAAGCLATADVSFRKPLGVLRNS